jgi:aspartate/methionine/tyrosine aminotransferase
MFAKRTGWNLAENAYAKALRAHAETSRHLLDLTVSNPTTCGFSYDEGAILSAFGSPVVLRYEPQSKGFLAARQAIAAYYDETHGLPKIDPEQILLTTGTSEAYSFLFRLLCEPGDEVAIAQPSYPLFEFLADIQDVRLRPFRLVYDHDWQIDFHALQHAITGRTRAILLLHPNNPTGHFIKESEAAELTRLCAERDLALIVDEVFLDYPLPGTPSSRPRNRSFAANHGAVTFVLSGLSKVSALPQVKLGWVVAAGPRDLVHNAMERLEIISDTYLSLSTPLQQALPVLLSQRTVIQSQLMARVSSNLQELDRQLRHNLVTRLEVEGGWYAVLRVPAIQSDEAFVIRLLERRSVAVHPGHFYDFAEDGYIVLSLLAPLDTFSAGLTRLLECASQTPAI